MGFVYYHRHSLNNGSWIHMNIEYIWIIIILVKSMPPLKCRNSNAARISFVNVTFNFKMTPKYCILWITVNVFSLHSSTFIYIEMNQVVKILPEMTQISAYLTWSTPWLLMTVEGETHIFYIFCSLENSNQVIMGLCCGMIQYYIDGLVQVCSNSIAIALELPQTCTKPLIWYFMVHVNN